MDVYHEFDVSSFEYGQTNQNSKNLLHSIVLSVSFPFKIEILEMTTGDSTKSFASVAATTNNSKGSGQMGDAGFKTRQRPDTIRNSNIVAAKGKLSLNNSSIKRHYNSCYIV
jgi:hypothetical protein